MSRHTLSTEAKYVLAAIASGKLLRFDLKTGAYRLIDPPTREQAFGPVMVSRAIAIELFAVPGLLAEVAAGRIHQRVGLIDLGITDFDRAQYWRVAQ